MAVGGEEEEEGRKGERAFSWLRKERVKRKGKSCVYVRLRRVSTEGDRKRQDIGLLDNNCSCSGSGCLLFFSCHTHLRHTQLVLLSWRKSFSISKKFFLFFSGVVRTKLEISL